MRPAVAPQPLANVSSSSRRLASGLPAPPPPSPRAQAQQASQAAGKSIKAAVSDVRKAMSALSVPFVNKDIRNVPFPLQKNTRLLIDSLRNASENDAEATTAFVVETLAREMTLFACQNVYWLSRRQVAAVQSDMCAGAVHAAQVFKNKQALLAKLLALAVQSEKPPPARQASFLASVLHQGATMVTVVPAATSQQNDLDGQTAAASLENMRHASILLSRIVDERELTPSVLPVAQAVVAAMQQTLGVYRSRIDAHAFSEATKILSDLAVPLVDDLAKELVSNPLHHKALVQAGMLPAASNFLRGLFFKAQVKNLFESSLALACVRIMRVLAASSSANEVELLNAGAARAVVLRLRYLGNDENVHERIWSECLGLLQDLTISSPMTSWSTILQQGAGNTLIRALACEGRGVRLGIGVKRLAVAVMLRLYKDEEASALLLDGTRFWPTLESYASNDGYDDEHRDLSMALVQVAWFHALRCGAHRVSTEMLQYVAMAVFVHKSAAAKSLLLADVSLRAKVLITALTLDVDLSHDIFTALWNFAEHNSIEILEQCGLLSGHFLNTFSSRMSRSNVSPALKFLSAIWTYVDSSKQTPPLGLVTAMSKALFEFDTIQSRALAVVSQMHKTEAAAQVLRKGLDFPHSSCRKVNEVLLAMRAFAKDDAGAACLSQVGVPNRIKGLYSHECDVETSVVALLLCFWRNGDFPSTASDSKSLEFLHRQVFKLRNAEVVNLLNRFELHDFSISFYLAALQRDNGSEANVRVFRHFANLLERPSGAERVLAMGFLDRLTVHEANRAQALDLIEPLVEEALKAGPLSVNTNRGLVSFLTRESLDYKNQRASTLLLRVVPRYGNIRGEIQALSKEELVERTTCSICRERLHDPRMAHPCMHEFCNECLSGWLKNSARKDCPLCRAPVADSFSAVSAVYALERLALEFPNELSEEEDL